MRTWSVHEARSRFKDIFEAAHMVGPQKVSRHGRDSVVIVSEPEWERLLKTFPSFAETLTSCPLSDEDLPARKPSSRRGDFL